MAIAGGATTAYKCRVVDGFLHVTRTSGLRSQCVKVAEAIEQLGRGETVTVAGSDMGALRSELEKVLG